MSFSLSAFSGKRWSYRIEGSTPQGAWPLAEAWPVNITRVCVVSRETGGGRPLSPVLLGQLLASCTLRDRVSQAWGSLLWMRPFCHPPQMPALLPDPLHSGAQATLGFLSGISEARSHIGHSELWD